MSPKLLKRPEVERLVLLSRATLYRLMATGDFPRPVRLAQRSVAWRRADVEEWIDSRPAASTSA